MSSITLRPDEIAFAERIGNARQRWNEQRRHQDAYGLSSSQAAHTNRLGAQAEMAVARALRLPWNPITDDPWRLDGDVGSFEIRSTTHPIGRLILHPKDCQHKADRPFILVRCAPPTFDLVGWYRPSEGVADEWWKVYRSGGGAWYVPCDCLHPVTLLM